MHISRAELGAAIAEAHARKLKVTAHLCSVTYPEAAALGIDDLEHGPMYYDMEFAPGKEPDVCPSAAGDVRRHLEDRDVRRARARADRRSRQAQGRRHLDPAGLRAPGPGPPAARPARARGDDAGRPRQLPVAARGRRAHRVRPAAELAALLKKEMEFEYAFVEGGRDAARRLRPDRHRRHARRASATSAKSSSWSKPASLPSKPSTSRRRTARSSSARPTASARSPPASRPTSS